VQDEFDRWGPWKFVLIMTALFSTVAGSIFGVAQSVRTGDCKYHRLIQFHPAYVISCELFKVRFE